jgi:hypothetical protein
MIAFLSFKIIQYQNWDGRRAIKADKPERATGRRAILPYVGDGFRM